MATEDARKLFVAGLPESITEDVLRQLFEATGGKVVDVSLPRDRTTGRPRGFGFVTFSTPQEAVGARRTLDGSLQAGRAISVRPFSSEPPRRGEGGPGSRAEGSGPAEDRTLYVGNLPYDITQAEVYQLFEDNSAGPVVRVHLPVGPDGRLRGFGFVTLATAEAANSAIVALRNVEVRGRRLMVNIAHPKGAPNSQGERPRSTAPRSHEGGGWGGEPRFDGGSDLDGARGADSRRAKLDDDSEEEARSKKKKKRGGGPRDRSEKKAGGNWKSWQDWDDDDK